jgi:hypothetical protein
MPTVVGFVAISPMSPTEVDATTRSAWTVDTLKEYIVTSINDLRAAQEALRISDDLRYQQRFDAQQKAVVDALLAAEKAVNAALASADRAVVKAETAAEKRFESVNEFRSVLSNQSATLMPRTEADGQFRAVNDKIADLKARLDRGEGSVGGQRAERADNHMTLGSVLGIVGGAVGALTLLAAVIFGIANMGHQQPPPALIPGQSGTQTTPIAPR